MEESEPWRPYWTKPVLEFVATVVPTVDEVFKHFMLPTLEEKLKNPLVFSSSSGDEVKVIIMFLTRGDNDFKLNGWTTVIERGSIEKGSWIRKCVIAFRQEFKTARVLFEKEGNQEVVEIRIKE